MGGIVFRALRPIVLAVLVPAVATAATSPPKPLHVEVFADTGIRLTDVVWTGTQFLYVENTTNRIWAAGPQGAPLSPFASLPNEVEETRCALSPGAHGFPRGALFCHAPDNTIYSVAADGSHAVFATLPNDSVSDGALAFDTSGRFGYALLAATGRSGSPTGGGEVYAVTATGSVRLVGTYPGPGGADAVAVAPARFRTAPGRLVITVDAGERGTIVLMDARGRTRTVGSLPDGPNPIAVVAAPSPRTRGAARPGFYATDTASHDVFLVPAAQLAPYVGDLLVASEIKGLFWIVRPRPRGRGIQVLRLRTDLPAAVYNLEGATYVP